MSITRSGLNFKATMTTGENTGGMERMLQLLLEERQLREEQQALEHERREREHRVQVELMQEQMQAMRGWMERSMTREDERVGRAHPMQHRLAVPSPSTVGPT